MSTHRLLNTGSLFVVMPAVLLAATLLLPAQEAQPAKEPQPAKETAPAAKASPVAIPADEIPQKSSQDEIQLQQIRLSIGTTDQGVEEIKAELPPEADAIRQLVDAPENEALHQLDLSDLANLTFSWESHARRLAGWQARLQRRSSSTSETLRSLSVMQETWTLTRSTASAAGAPAALMERIDSLLKTSADVDSLVQERLSALLTLQGQVSSEQVRVAEALQRVAIATGQAGRRLLTLDSGPIWTVLLEPGAAESLSVQVLQVWSQQAAEISRFLSENRMRARLHALLFFLLILAAVVLNLRRRSQMTGSAPLDAAAMLLGRPVAASLLVSLVATRWIYPVLPMSVSKLILLAVAVPVLRLLPRLAIPSMRLPVFQLAALFVLDRLRDLAIGQPVLFRLLLLAVSAMGVVLLVWTTLPRGQTGKDRSGWVRLASGLLRVGAALLGVALVANVAGAVALARLLTGGTLTSTFIAIVLFASVLVIDAMFTAMHRDRSAETGQPPRPHVVALQKWGRTLIRLGAGLVWLRVTLVLFGEYHPLVNSLTMVLSRRWQFGGFDVSISELLSFLLVLAVSFALSRILPLVLEEGVLVRTAVPLGLRATISTLVQFVLMALGFMVALSAAGIELSQFALLAGALGVGIGFGLQTMVSNFVSGVILAFERPVEVGDIVQVGALTGRMRHIGLRASIIRLPDGAEVIVPNANLITNEVVNWSLSDRTRRVELPVSVARGTDPKLVVQVLVDAALGQTGALRSPAPFALFHGFGEDSLDFVLYCWSPTFDISLKLISDLGLAVHEALKQAGIEIARPQRDVHLRTVTQEADRAIAKPAPEQPARRPLGSQMKSSSDP